MNLANKKLAPDLETIFLMSEQGWLHVQAKIVREISKYDIDQVCGLDLVPAYVKQKLKEKYG
jgi:pantetheine-phosphate adenylyltransferase